MRYMRGLIYSLAVLLIGSAQGQAPVVNSIAPRSGVVGSTVRLQGANFNAVASSNIVMFGGIRAEVRSATINEITVVVPPGAAYGPISVANNNLTAFSLPFVVTFPGTGTLSSSSMQAAGTLATADRPKDVRIADIDGDGLGDLIVTATNTLSIYRGRDDGSFTDSIAYAAKCLPSRITVADLNADGKPELILADNPTNTISVFKNETSGEIAEGEWLKRIDFNAGAGPREVAIGDLDGDGKLDLAVANFGSDTLSVLRNQSPAGIIDSASFASETQVSVGTNVAGIAIADVNGDNKPDIVVANETAGRISILPNNSTGPASLSFGARRDFSAGTNSRPMAVAVGDLDDDGKADIAAATYGSRSLTVFKNLSTSTVSLAPKFSLDVKGLTHNLAIGDLDGNGKPDLVAVSQSANKITVFQNISTNGALVAGSFGSGIDFLTGWNPINFAIADLDGDSRSDVITANNFGTNLTLFRSQVVAVGAPVITAPPRSKLVAAGTDLILTVGAIGSEPLSYQWSFDGNPLPGATNSTFLVSNVQTSNAGSYSVSVTNSIGAAYSSSAVITVDLIPIISPHGATTNNDVIVSLSCANPSAELYWNFNNADAPSSTNGNRYIEPFVLGTSGTLKVAASSGGFAGGQIASALFNFLVSEPTMFPGGGVYSNEINVVISGATENASVYWTDDGSEPSETSNLYGGNSIPLNGSKTLKIIGFKNGYTPSATIASNYTFVVADPVITPNGAVTSGVVRVSIASQTQDAEIYYAINSSYEPSPTNGVRYTGPFDLATSGHMRVKAYKNGYNPSQIVSANFTLAVNLSAPAIDPPRGYFPNGTLVTLSHPLLGAGVQLFYTTNGEDPTTNDIAYSGPFYIDQIFFPVPEMRVLKVRAFAPGALPSPVVSGGGFETNCVGVPRDMVAGIGSTIVVPVVANLAPNQGVRSLQFRMEVIPQGAAPSLTKDIVGLSSLLNDFVPLAGESADGNPVSAYYNHYTIGPISGVWYASIATNMLITNGFGFVANFSVPIPETAIEGQRYTIQVSQTTGTADAQQRPVTLYPLPDRTITVSNVAYLVGDCSPGRWYNAADFGNGNLDNADVNMAFLAAAGIRTPHLFSDAFNAMDLYPEDTTVSVGGDGVLEFFDWNLLLKRSLRLDINNWQRFWSLGGVLGHTQRTLSKSAARSPAKSVLSPVSSRPGTVWFCKAQIEAQSFTNVAPGVAYDIPVFVNVLPGYSIVGLQLRAGITANGGPVSESSPLGFIPAPGLPTPMTANYNHGIACGWASWPESAFNPPLEGSNLLGYIRWKVPANAMAGQVFDLHFGFCSGASEDDQPAQIETYPARFAVLASGTGVRDAISDEWKIKFFGRVDAAAARANVDADGDGLSNLAEYLAGTAPNDAGSSLKFENARPGQGARTVTLRWLSAPGKSYVIEHAPALTGAGWTAITNLMGDGEFQTVTDSNATSQARFYRIRLQ